MEKIELRKVRDFSGIFNDTILFLRRNFRSVFGTLLYLAGPFIIMTGLISGYMQSLQNKLMMGGLFNFNLGSNAGLLTSNFLGTLAIFILIYMLTTIVNTACICLYFKTYDQSPAADLPIQRGSISSNLAGTCWRLFYNLVLLTIIMTVVILVVVGVCSVLFMIPGLNILFGIALFFGLLIVLPVVGYVLYVANYIVIRDEVLITEAIGKAWRYVKGNYWWTWLLMVAVLLALSIAGFVFQVPLFIVTMAQAFIRAADPSHVGDSTILTVVCGAIAMVGQLLFVSPVFYSFCIFNFYSHEERHEGTGLMSRIDEVDVK